MPMAKWIYSLHILLEIQQRYTFSLEGKLGLLPVRAVKAIVLWTEKSYGKRILKIEELIPAEMLTKNV